MRDGSDALMIATATAGQDEYEDAEPTFRDMLKSFRIVFLGHTEFEMDKNAILRVRVTDTVHADFLAVCEALGRTPAAVLRELVERHVATHSINLEDDVRITIERPAGYDYGACVPG